MYILIMYIIFVLLHLVITRWVVSLSRKTFILVDTEDCAQKLRCVFYEIDHRLEILDSGTRVKVQYHMCKNSSHILYSNYSKLLLGHTVVVVSLSGKPSIHFIDLCVPYLYLIDSSSDHVAHVICIK